MSEESWPRVAVVGAGAVGCYYGGMLARAGAPVTLIGRPVHVDAIVRDGLLLDTLQFKERVSVTASTDMAAAHCHHCDSRLSRQTRSLRREQGGKARLVSPRDASLVKMCNR